MSKYEVLYIVKPTLTDEEVAAVAEKTKALVENMQGEVTKVEVWGKKKLCYEVKKFAEGYYVLMNMSATSEIVNELNRQFRISDTVIRHLLTKIEEK